MALHEAVHGLGFLVVGERSRYRFGLAMGLPAIVVTCEGLVIRWWQMVAIGLFPLVLLTGLGTVLALSAPATTLAVILMISANAAGACGDLYVQLRVITCRVRWGSGSVTGTKDGFVYETAVAVTQDA